LQRSVDTTVVDEEMMIDKMRRMPDEGFDNIRLIQDP